MTVDHGFLQLAMTKDELQPLNFPTMLQVLCSKCMPGSVAGDALVYFSKNGQILQVHIYLLL